MCAGIDSCNTNLLTLAVKYERETGETDLEGHDVRDDHHRLRPPVHEVSQEQEVSCETPRVRVSPSAKRCGSVRLCFHFSEAVWFSVSLSSSRPIFSEMHRS